MLTAFFGLTTTNFLANFTVEMTIGKGHPSPSGGAEMPRQL